jgi:hypothetical protein
MDRDTSSPTALPHERSERVRGRRHHPGLQLAHRGFQHGIFVAEEIAGLNPIVIGDVNIHKVTYSDPEVASVGLSQVKAQENAVRGERDRLRLQPCWQRQEVTSLEPRDPSR